MWKPTLAAITLFVLMSACTSIPVKTLYKLSTTNLMTVDPKVIRAAIRIPNVLQEDKKGIVLELASWKLGEKPNPIELKLKRVEKPEEVAPLKKHERQGYTLAVYQLTEKDIKRVELLRAEHKKRKEKFGKSNVRGSFSVTSYTCRTRPIDDTPLLITNWLKVDQATGYLPTITDHDMKKALKGKDLDKKLPLCKQ